MIMTANFFPDFMYDQILSFRQGLPGFDIDNPMSDLIDTVALSGILSISNRKNLLLVNYLNAFNKFSLKESDILVTLYLYDGNDENRNIKSSIHFKWDAETIYFRSPLPPSEIYPWGISFLLVNANKTFVALTHEGTDADGNEKFLYKEKRFSDFKNHSLSPDSKSNSPGHNPPPFNTTTPNTGKFLNRQS